MIWFQLFLWVATFVLTDYFREKLPSVTPSGIGDFQIPTATEGRVVPIIPGGTVRVGAPNCIWYGDFEAEPITVETGIIFKRDEEVGFLYRLALQYALFKGEAAGITGVWIGDDEIYRGVAVDVVDIDRPDLFGGDQSGGGFEGRIRLFNGSQTQAVSAFLDTRIDPLPAYRGTCYVMVTSLDETTGANIGESNQLRHIRIEVQTFDTLANGGLNNTLALTSDMHIIGPDSNPMSVAYELYVNTEWGRRFAISDVDLASFQAAAVTCFNEGIGFSLLIDELTSTGNIEDIISQHIDGQIGPNPITGKIEVKLSRQDYVLANEFQATVDNILEVKKWNRADWSQTINKVRVRFTDRDAQWKEKHAVEVAPGNRVIQGRNKTKDVRYEGCHTASVAALLAARSKRSLGQPIDSGTLVMNREAYALRPGSVMSVTTPKIKGTNVPVRVTKVGVGTVTMNSIEVDVVKDVFDFEAATVADPPPTDFVPPIQAVVPFAVADQAAFEAPFILMRYDLQPGAVPRVATLARRAAGNTPTEYEVIRRVRNPPTAFSGAYTSTDLVAAGFTTCGTLRNAETDWTTGNGGLTMQIDPIGSESLDGLIGTYAPGLGNAAGVAVISPGLADEEFIIFGAIVDDLTGVRLENIWRACMDTGWKNHLAGAQIWFIWTGGLGMGSEVYNIGDGVDMKFLPRSPSDEILEAEATSLPEVSLDENTDTRNGKPLMPIGLTANGGSFPVSVDYEVVHTTPSAFTGGAYIPTLRAFNQQDILLSVMGFASDDTDFNPSDVTEQVLEVAWWLHDLDADPTANRSFALAESSGFVAQATAADQFDVLKSALVAGGAVGFSFNARLEIETRHSPAGQVALQVSHETMNFDHEAIGIFSVLESDVLFLSHFDGADAATEADDASSWNQFIEVNGAAQVDTAQSVFGSASMLFDGIDSYLRTPIRDDFDIADEWTVEMRARFTADPAGTVDLCGQMDGGGTNSWMIIYDGALNQFQIAYSTTGVNGPIFFGMHSITWAPVAGTWYALAFCKEPDNKFHVFVDGVEIGNVTTFASTWFRSGSDILIGARNFSGTPSSFFDGHIEELRITPRCIYKADYTIETLAFSDGRGIAGLLCHMEGTDTAVLDTSEDLTGFTLTATGTSQIDTAQSKFGSSAFLFNGVNSLTLATADGLYLAETQNRRDPAFTFGRDPFTMECHFRLAALPSTNAGNGFALIAKYFRGGSAGFDWIFVLPSTNTQLQFLRSPTGAIASQQNFLATIPTLVINTWYHAAAERVGNDLHLYFEGVRVGQSIDHFAASPDMWNNDAPSQTGNKDNPVTIGRLYGVSSVARIRAFNGWIDEVNIEKRAIYNASSYTIPTGPTRPDPVKGLVLSDYDDIVLLSGFENVDGFTTDHLMQTEDVYGFRLDFGNQSQIDTANFKFGTSSLLFDGGNDFMRIHASRLLHNFGSGDFTIDLWADMDILPQNSGNTGMSLVSKWTATGNLRSWAFYLDDTGASSDLVFAWSVDGTVIKTAFVLDYVPTVGVWTHFEVSREGSTLRIFIDGVLQTLDAASDAIGTDIIFNSGERIIVGWLNEPAGSDKDYDGHIDELRILRRNDHTATFTPMAVPYTRPTRPVIL